MALELISSAFNDGDFIPAKYTGDGEDVSPPLKWTEPTANTKAFALICDDPDAPRATWVHWVVYNIPPTTMEFPEGMPKDSTLPNGTHARPNRFRHHRLRRPRPAQRPAAQILFQALCARSYNRLKTRRNKSGCNESHPGPCYRRSNPDGQIPAKMTESWSFIIIAAYRRRTSVHISGQPGPVWVSRLVARF